MNAEVLHRDTEDTVMSSGDVVTPSKGEVMSSAMDTSGDGRANYDSIPAELKLKIWENVAMPSGVHYFHMQPSFRRQHTVTQHVLIQPWKPAASDTSAWRVRNAHKWTDEFAWDVLSKKLEGKEDAVRQFWPRDERIHTHWQPVSKEYQVALVNLATDLVIFKCTGMFLHKHFIPMPEWQEFSGVTRVGMTFHNPTGPFHRRAFACACALQIHSRISLCPYFILSFMSYFRHLKTFYFVYKINGNTIKFKDPKANQGVSRTTLTRPYFNYFREIALREGLETFEDAKYTYYEVREEDATDKFRNDDIWTVFHTLEDEFQRNANKDPCLWKRVNLKVVVIADLDKAP